MFARNEAPLHIILVVVALVCFAFAGFGWPAPIEPYRVKLIGVGLFFPHALHVLLAKRFAGK